MPNYSPGSVTAAAAANAANAALPQASYSGTTLIGSDGKPVVPGGQLINVQGQGPTIYGQNPGTPPGETLPTEPTVVTSDNITNNVIPALNDRAAAVATKGTYVGQDGKTYYSDGSMVPAPLDATYDPTTQTYSDNTGTYGAAPQYIDNPTNDPDIAQTNTILAGLKQSLDSSTLSQVNSIQDQYTTLIANQSQANSDAANDYSHYETVTGGSRRAPLDAASGALVSANYGIQQIAKLNSDEDSAISQVKVAQSNGDYQLMSKALDEVDSIRTAKQDAATKVQDTLSAANDAANAQKLQVAQDTAVGQLVAQGITDPAEVLKEMNAAGYNVTADQVAASLKNLTPTAAAGAAYKFSNTDVGSLLGSGLSTQQIQAVQDYYNGKGSATALDGLTAAQKAAVQTALVGKTAAASGDGKTLTSGSLKYTADDISEGAAKLQASKGSDGYVDPNVYLNLAQAWTSQGGSIKDFIKNYPVSSWVNPVNTFVTPAINALIKQDAAGTKTTGTAATDISTEIDGLFANNPS